MILFIIEHILPYINITATYEYLTAAKVSRGFYSCTQEDSCEINIDFTITGRIFSKVLWTSI